MTGENSKRDFLLRELRIGAISSVIGGTILALLGVPLSWRAFRDVWAGVGLASIVANTLGMATRKVKRWRDGN
jgi:hypothetical protein